MCYVSYSRKNKDKNDWTAVLMVKPQNIVDLPHEEVETTLKLNVPFKVEEVEFDDIDMIIFF